MTDRRIIVCHSWLERLTPLAVVSFAVFLNILGGVLLKELADHPNLSLYGVGVGLVLVLLFNGLRLALWGYTHERFPLSQSYLVTAVFFPLMLGVAALYEEPIHVQEVVGATFITLGVFWMTMRAPVTAPSTSEEVETDRC